MSQDRWNLERLLRAGGIAYVGALFSAGLSRLDALQRARERFPLADDRSLVPLVERGRSAFQAANLIDALDPAGRLGAGQYPGGGAGAKGYLYTGVVTYNDPRSGASAQRTFQVASATNLTAAEVRNRMTQAANIHQQSAPQYPNHRPLPEGVEAQEVDLYSAHRW